MRRWQCIDRARRIDCFVGRTKVARGDIHTVASPGGELRGQVLPVLLFGDGFEE